MRRSPVSIPTTSLLLVVLALSALSVSGCRWFRKDSAFLQSSETRPLEVPPDLDRPNTDAAIGGAPASVTRSTMTAAAPAAAANGFTVPGQRDAVFAKVGDVLAATPGLTIASRAELLGSFDVSYEGANFLVRVAPVQSGVQVSAVDPRGIAASAPAATKLIAALKASLAR